MKRGNIAVVYLKELKDALRDRRTIFSTIILPLIMFPLMTIGFGSMAARSARKVQQEVFNVMILGAEQAPELSERLHNSRALHLEKPSTNYSQMITAKRLRAAVIVPPNFERDLKSKTNSPAKIEIAYYAGEVRSQFALRSLQQLLREYSDQLVEQRLRGIGLSREILRPFAVAEENVASPEKVGGNMFGGLIPYMIIFLSFVGAMSPAMDLTAGEKERGTMETILASPIRRGELVLGKFLMVLTASITTTLISLTSFGLTLTLSTAAVHDIGAGRNVLFQLSISHIAAVFLLILPLAVMFSGVLLAVSLFAKTYKEAQSYISPMMMLVLLPAMAGLLPGYELNSSLALAPVLNVTLVSKEILTGQYQWHLIGIVLGSTCIYAAAALLLASFMFRRESVIFRGC